VATLFPLNIIHKRVYQLEDTEPILSFFFFFFFSFFDFSFVEGRVSSVKASLSGWGGYDSFLVLPQTEIACGDESGGDWLPLNSVLYRAN
jgi:hypothetical protein